MDDWGIRDSAGGDRERDDRGELAPIAGRGSSEQGVAERDREWTFKSAEESDYVAVGN